MRNLRNQPEANAASDTSYYGIKSDLAKIFSIRFCSDPVVTEKHHCLSARPMYDIDKLFCLLCHKSLDKIHIIAICLCRHTEGRIVIPIVHNILRTQRIAVFLFKLFQSLHGNSRSVSEPVYEFFLCLAVKYECKMIEKCRKTHDIRIRIILKPLCQIFLCKFAGGTLADIKGYLMRLISPVIRDMVIHLCRIPDRIYKERYRVLVEWLRMFYNHTMFFRINLPVICRNDFTRRSVNDLPPFFRIMEIVRNHLFLIIPLHKSDRKLLVNRCIMAGHQIKLLTFLHMLFCEFIVSARHKICRINLCVKSLDVIIKLRTIAVAQRVRTPALQHFLRLVQKIRFTWKRYPSFCLCHFHTSHYIFCRIL